MWSKDAVCWIPATLGAAAPARASPGCDRVLLRAFTALRLAFTAAAAAAAAAASAAAAARAAADAFNHPPQIRPKIGPGIPPPPRIKRFKLLFGVNPIKPVHA